MIPNQRALMAQAEINYTLELGRDRNLAYAAGTATGYAFCKGVQLANVPYVSAAAGRTCGILENEVIKFIGRIIRNIFFRE